MGSAYIQQQSLELNEYDETPNLVSFLLIFLTDLNLQHIIQASCLKHTCFMIIESFYGVDFSN